MVSAATDGTVSVWDIRSGQELFQIYGHADGVNSLQFDREQLVTDGEPIFDLLLHACRVVVGLVLLPGSLHSKSVWSSLSTF